MKIPVNASDDFEPKLIGEEVKENKPIKNTYFEQEYLSLAEAVDLMNWITARMLMELKDGGG